MIDHDRIFKELITTFFLEFIALFLPEVYSYLDPDSLEFLDKELVTDVTSGERYTVDVLAKLRFQDQDAAFLIHVEDQNQPQTGFNRRMFRYFARLTEKYDLPVYPIALFTYDQPHRPESDRYQIAFPDRTVLDFSFVVIQLNRLNWRDYVNRPNPVASALMAKMKIAVEDRPRVKLECLRLLATLKLNPAKMQLIYGFLETYLRLNREEYLMFEAATAELLPEENEPMKPLFFTQWHEEGMEIGIEKGIERGIEQGIEQGERRITLRQLRHKFGEVPATIEGQVQELSRAQLEAFGDMLLDFTQIEDVTQWLDKNRELQTVNS